MREASSDSRCRRERSAYVMEEQPRACCLLPVTVFEHQMGRVPSHRPASPGFCVLAGQACWLYRFFLGKSILSSRLERSALYENYLPPVLLHAPDALVRACMLLSGVLWLSVLIHVNGPSVRGREGRKRLTRPGPVSPSVHACRRSSCCTWPQRIVKDQQILSSACDDDLPIEGPARRVAELSLCVATVVLAGG